MAHEINIFNLEEVNLLKVTYCMISLKKLMLVKEITCVE